MLSSPAVPNLTTLPAPSRLNGGEGGDDGVTWVIRRTTVHFLSAAVVGVENAKQFCGMYSRRSSFLTDDWECCHFKDGILVED